jgi:hypothetical protein
VSVERSSTDRGFGELGFGQPVLWWPAWSAVIVLGLICLIIGLVFGIGVLWVIGIILVVVGLILELLGTMGRAVGGRRHYY